MDYRYNILFQWRSLPGRGEGNLNDSGIFG